MMNISVRKMAIATATIMLCIVATWFWPSSNQQKKKDNTIRAAVVLPPAKRDTVQVVTPPAEPKPQPQTPPVQDTPGPAVVATEDGAFTVQVASWRSRWKAELDLQRYQDRGFDAYIQRVHIPEKGGVWHRVRLGRFSSRETATEQAEALQEMLQAGYWISTR